MNPFDPYGLIDRTLAVYDRIHAAKIAASRPEPETDAEILEDYEQNGRRVDHV